jgi:hypothetical protein
MNDGSHDRDYLDSMWLKISDFRLNPETEDVVHIEKILKFTYSPNNRYRDYFILTITINDDTIEPIYDNIHGIRRAIFYKINEYILYMGSKMRNSSFLISFKIKIKQLSNDYNTSTLIQTLFEYMTPARLTINANYDVDYSALNLSNIFGNPRDGLCVIKIYQDELKTLTINTSNTNTTELFKKFLEEDHEVNVDID